MIGRLFHWRGSAKPLDVKTRVRIAVLLPISLIACAEAWYFASDHNSDIDQALHQRGREVVRHLAEAALPHVSNLNREALTRLAESAQTHSELRSAQILGHRGEVLARAGTPLSFHYMPAGHEPAEAGDDQVLTFRYPIPADRESMAVVQLDLQDLAAHKHDIFAASLVSIALSLLLGWGVAELLSRRVLRQVEYIAQAVASISQGNFEARVETMAGGSLEHLAERINDMTRQLATLHSDMQKRIQDATEELRVRKEDAERANVAKSRFLASASHDLRQPMHALVLFVAQLEASAENPETRRLAHQIAESARALESLMDSLLDISKLEAGVLKPKISAFPLMPLLARIGNDHMGPAEQKGLYLRVRPSELWVRTDGVLLERILMNLVSNAVRYTSAGGIMVACRRRAEQVCIEVRDSGIGIAEDDQAVVFQEFVQLDNSSRDRSKGLGLGLSIVHKTASLLGLSLNLRSRPGQGSTFSVLVPLTTPEIIHAAPTSNFVPQHELDGKLVVVIDDDPLVLDSVAGLLRSWNCKVVAASNSRLAVQGIAQARATPDAVLCDYRLAEGKNGVDVLRAMRIQYGRHLPAALISGDTAPEVLRTAKDAGLALLHKPVAPAKLRTLLQRLMMKSGIPADIR